MNAAGHTALFTACFEGHENVVKLLLKHGADVNKYVFEVSAQYIVILTQIKIVHD